MTICTKDRQCFLAEIQPTVGADDSVRPYGASAPYTYHLTPMGAIIRDCMEQLDNADEGVSVEKYVIMPNHVHALIYIEGDGGGQSRPPLQRVVQRFKSITTRRCWEMDVKTIWQRSFYDHVIRNERDYLRAWQYIDDNPARWAEDEYFA